jgi:hypothetical protein
MVSKNKTEKENEFGKIMKTTEQTFINILNWQLCANISKKNPQTKLGIKLREQRVLKHNAKNYEVNIYL